MAVLDTGVAAYEILLPLGRRHDVVPELALEENPAPDTRVDHHGDLVARAETATNISGLAYEELSPAGEVHLGQKYYSGGNYPESGHRDQQDRDPPYKRYRPGSNG